MQHKLFLLFFAALLGAGSIVAQSTSELESRYKKAGTKPEKLNYSFQLAQKYLDANNAGKAIEYARIANPLSIEVGDKRKHAESAYIQAEGEFRRKNYKEASARFQDAWQAARNYGLRDIALNAVERIQETASRQNDLKEALKWSRETVNYLKENGGGGARGGGDAQRRLEDQLNKAEVDNRSLREQLAKATGQTQLLETSYKETEANLRTIQEKSQQQISAKEAELSQATQDKEIAKAMIASKDLMMQDMTKEQMADSVIQARTERQLETEKTKNAEAELGRKRSDYQRNILALLAGFVFVLAGAFYLRYRAKRRSVDDLAQKNVALEDERQRSDALLLNILPPAIAQELKTRNKVAARKYDQATVMFVDFTGFTHVAERLSPEILVEELDFCFSNFDRIIGQYRIEKIKTIGDAYLCASGLSDMNASPSDMVKAGLEIQDFLQHIKAERMSNGLPHFEARVGIHVGPVVAGVVGAKKFAYDIWGDTVNIAARMEQSCEPGRVNVSEDAHNLAKYEFEWQYRGRLAAKNKGDMEMYYVTSMKQY